MCLTRDYTRLDPSDRFRVIDLFQSIASATPTMGHIPEGVWLAPFALHLARARVHRHTVETIANCDCESIQFPFQLISRKLGKRVTRDKHFDAIFRRKFETYSSSWVRDASAYVRIESHMCSERHTLARKINLFFYETLSCDGKRELGIIHDMDVRLRAANRQRAIISAPQ